MCLQPLLSLDNSVTTRFTDAGDVRVTVQAACGNSVLQDSRLIRVLGELSPDSLHRPAWVGTWLQRACSLLGSPRLQSPGGFGFCDWLCGLIEVFQTLCLQFPLSIKCLMRLVSLLHSYLPRTGELDVGISTGLSTCTYHSEDGPEEDLGMAIAYLGSLGL